MAYVIITAAGYWGKGDTMNQAAKNANVRAQYVRGKVIKVDPRLYTEVEVDGMGGISKHMTEELADAPAPLRAGVRDTSDMGYFQMKMTKGNLTLSVIED